jgi:tripartite-type tricarboxylate transporter receptor subunit TctC
VDATHLTDRRSFLKRSGATIAAASLGSAIAVAQSAAYPTKAIKVIVPFPAGGAADATMRLISTNLASALGQPIVIENKVGANGAIGAAAVATSEADGYTLLMAPREVFGINPLLYKSLPYDPVDGFEPVGIVAEAAYVLVANPTLGARSMKDFLALAATRELNYASFGIGSMGHLNLEALARETKIKLTHIPFRGAPQAVQAVVSGDVAIAISTAPAALGLIQEGKLVALAVGSA